MLYLLSIIKHIKSKHEKALFKKGGFSNDAI
jgi:hypothetical protein